MIDALIGLFSPKAKFKRLQYRAAIDVLGNHKRSYEGAARGRRTAGWLTSSTSANTEVGAGLSTLRNRSRDLVRNNPYAAKGVNVVTTNVVGKGLIPSIKRGGTQDEALTALWRAWAETSACDYEGRKNFYALQRLAMRSVVESGEVLILRRYVKGGSIPIKLQILESDFLPLNSAITTGVPSGNYVIHGVEFNAKGQRVAYHLYKNHPGNSGVIGVRTELDTVRVPAEDVIHLLRADRPGQVRGVPWLSPCIIRLRDFDEFEDAQLVRQKIAACFSVFVKDIEATGDLTEDQKDELGQKVEPGLIEILPPGKDVSFATPPPIEGYGEYTSVILHSIAAGLHITYESLTGDLAEVNFSSARMGWLEMGRALDAWRADIIDPDLNARAFDWFLAGAQLAGAQIAGASALFTAPRREMIDPTKEVPAAIKAIRAGIWTHDDVVRQNGKHPADHYAQIKENNDNFDNLGLVLDSDPRKTDASGSLQASEGEGSTNEN